jgi:hypothetical protein
MASARVGRDKPHHVAFVGDQLGTQLDIGGPLNAQRILRAVALGSVIGAIKQRIDRLLAFAVDDP